MRDYTKGLTDYIAERLQLSDAQLPRPGEWAGSGNTIGSIGLRLGVLSLDQIEQIIDLQSREGRLFGELAVQLRFATHPQIQSILELQQFHRCLDTGGLLLMNGRLDLIELLQLLTDYMRIQWESEED